ncbi:hypothetical protein J7E63_27025 [Bacillus sp. ISL-75]|uniref:hypothetical protein n=1 Tax=Bacillus sp. ISL-75 TaxID=2819137 RepID=UPI001BE6A6A3|nr:hypothetical protein [Bacillus sp. ISL-75]MBT2730483.1 hypothetical protein [Bacillus sp. ISL-75]
MLQFGSWFTPDYKSAWEVRLEYTSDYIIEKTGLNRSELTNLLHYLDEQNIIR